MSMVVSYAVSAGHALLGAGWLGAMLYSLFVVQPKAARFFADDDEHEAFLVTLGHGNRRPVVAMILALALSGVVLLWLTEPSKAAWVLHAVKGVCLLGASTIFAWVSWRMWPHRVFALPEERPAHRRALRTAAFGMVALVGTAFVLGVLASGFDR